MSAPVFETATEHALGYSADWIVEVFDNPFNTVEEVISILMRATGCDAEEASIETWEIDALGKSVVHHGEYEECSNVAEIIATIGIDVEVRREPVDVPTP